MLGLEKGPEGAAIFELVRAQFRKAQEKLRSEGLWNSALSASERSFLKAAPEAVTPNTRHEIIFLVEEAECLLWALGYVEMLPAYDHRVEITRLRLVPAQPLSELRTSATLRSRAVLLAAREAAELWTWRARIHQLVVTGVVDQVPGFEENIANAVAEVLDAAASCPDMPPLVGGDLPLFGMSYPRLGKDDWALASAISRHRFRALSWLCGFPPEQDEPLSIH